MRAGSRSGEPSLRIPPPVVIALMARWWDAEAASRIARCSAGLAAMPTEEVCQPEGCNRRKTGQPDLKGCPRTREPVCKQARAGPCAVH